MTIAVLGVALLFFLGMGVYALAAPAKMIRVFGITLPEPQSRSEVRAVYGGFGLAIAGVLAFAALQSSPECGLLRTGIMITVGLALAGMAFGRIVSAIVDGRTPFYPNWFYFLTEAIGAAALLLTARGR